MKHYTVNITDEAIADMDDIYNYIAVRLMAPQNALKQYQSISGAILSLEVFPERFEIMESSPEYSLGIRRMVVDNYLVCYVVDEEVVTVIAVLYGASDIHKKLNSRIH